MTINKVKINTMETKPTTKFKAVLGLVALFVGGLTVLGLTMWLGCSIWWDMIIRWAIK